MTVSSSHESLIRKAVNYLAEKGATRIGLLYFGNSKSNPPNPLAEATSRRTIFKQEMAKVGLPVNEKWMIANIPLITPGAGWESFRELWFAENQKPDGLIVTDDILFQEAIMAICELGIKVPDQLTICTHANKGGFTLYPFPVARIELDVDYQANLMGEMLLRAVRGEPIAESNIIVEDVLTETASSLTVHA